MEWVTKSGQIMPISKMSDRHLSNAIDCLERIGFTHEAKYRALLVEQCDRIKKKIVKLEDDYYNGDEFTDEDAEELCEAVDDMAWWCPCPCKDCVNSNLWTKEKEANHVLAGEKTNALASAVQSIAEAISTILRVLR